MGRSSRGIRVRGGNVPNPTYEWCPPIKRGMRKYVGSSSTELVSYRELLTIFLKSHDPHFSMHKAPTTEPAIDPSSCMQMRTSKRRLEKVLEEARKKKMYRGKIVTEVAPLKAFYMPKNTTKTTSPNTRNSHTAKSTSNPRLAV